jgi:hypothetical protein
MLSVGPRVELSHSYGDQRTSHVLSLPVNVGFTAGDGFRPELGAGFDYHIHAWRPGARFDRRQSSSSAAIRCAYDAVASHRARSAVTHR